MNSRVLGLKSSSDGNSSSDAQSKLVLSPYDLSEEQMIEIEDELLEDEVIREMEEIEEDFDSSGDDDDE